MNHEIMDRLCSWAYEFGFFLKEPPELKGKSGVTHSFDFVVRNGNRFCAVDIYKEISPFDVLRSYVKKLDTGASCYIVYLSYPLDDEVSRLIQVYQLGCFYWEELAELTKTKGQTATVSLRVRS